MFEVVADAVAGPEEEPVAASVEGPEPVSEGCCDS